MSVLVTAGSILNDVSGCFRPWRDCCVVEWSVIGPCDVSLSPLRLIEPLLHEIDNILRCVYVGGG